MQENAYLPCRWELYCKEWSRDFGKSKCFEEDKITVSRMLGLLDVFYGISVDLFVVQAIKLLTSASWLSCADYHHKVTLILGTPRMYSNSIELLIGYVMIEWFLLIAGIEDSCIVQDWISNMDLDNLPAGEMGLRVTCWVAISWDRIRQGLPVGYLGRS